jgi:hypothetical protein
MEREKQRTTPRSSKKVKLYAELHEALEDALLYERGGKPNLLITELVPAPKTHRPPKRRG